jgi:predicted AAA+ superfamily ATPase
MAKEQKRIFYRRQQLAQKLAERILSKNQVTAAVSGIFIGAPRRTGKTTFMRED